MWVIVEDRRALLAGFAGRLWRLPGPITRRRYSNQVADLYTLPCPDRIPFLGIEALTQ